MAEESDGDSADGTRGEDGNRETGDGVWTRLFGFVVAGVVAVVGLATLTSAGIGSPVSRVAFSVLLGVVAGQAAEGL